MSFHVASDKEGLYLLIKILMLKHLLFIIKQLSKITTQNLILPLVYRYFCLRNPKIIPGLILLADAHHTALPPSMRQMKQAIKANGLRPEEYTQDYAQLSSMALLGTMIHFMKLYSQAHYVFICDNFLPAASCRKRPETIVVQLWHGGGAFKKFGYDTEDDIPSWYLGNVFKNCDLVTVSGKSSVRPFASAMRLPEERIRPLGISRTDCYFSPGYAQTCRERLYQRFPDLEGKKLLLWAPTFRGNPKNGAVPGYSEIERLEAMLGPSWRVIKKLHPHIGPCQDEIGNLFAAEELLPVTDYLVTDYSSIVFDYLLFERPFAFFVPDLEEYAAKRGLYISLDEFPGEKTKTAEELYSAVTAVWDDERKAGLQQCRKAFMEACDGQASRRILEEIGLIKA